MTAPPARRVTFDGDCGQLVAHFFEPESTRSGPAVVVNHGSGDDQDSKPGVARMLTDAGYRVLVPYRRGYGESAGPARLEDVTAAPSTPEHGEQVCARLRDESRDIVAAVDHLRSVPGVEPTRIAVLGSSYGGITSILAAGIDPSVRTCVSFAAAAMSWEPVPEVQPLLLHHIDLATSPVLFLQAANDFDLTPSAALAARCDERGRDHERVILPAIGASPLEGHQIWTHAPFLWGPVVTRFLAQTL